MKYAYKIMFIWLMYRIALYVFGIKDKIIENDCCFTVELMFIVLCHRYMFNTNITISIIIIIIIIIIITITIFTIIKIIICFILYYVLNISQGL